MVFGFLPCSVLRKTISTSHRQDGKNIVFHTKGMSIFWVQRMRRQKHIEVIGVKNAAINANITLLSIMARNTHVHFQSVQTKRHWGLTKPTAVKVCMNISRQGCSQKEAESNNQELENYV